MLREEARITFGDVASNHIAPVRHALVDDADAIRDGSVSRLNDGTALNIKPILGRNGAALSAVCDLLGMCAAEDAP
mgnify:CR=1 FL=1